MFPQPNWIAFRLAALMLAWLASGQIKSVAAAGAGPLPRPELEMGRTRDYDYDPPEPGSYSLPVIAAAADGQVLDSTGQSRNLRDLVRGRITIVSFIYLRCASPTACPYATGVLNRIHALSGKDTTLAEQLRLITLSFDPAHDTPERMAAYGRLFESERSGPQWLFLTTQSERELKPILDAYGQVLDRRRNPNDPLGPYYHPVRVYLIDRKGQIRNIYSFGHLDPRLIVTDVRTLLLEESPGGASQGG